MKRYLCLILTLSVILGMGGCAFGRQMDHPVKFYYLSQYPADEVPESVMEPELREAGSHYRDLEYLLRLYLAGPESRTVTTPFPQGLALVSLNISDSAAEVILTDHLGDLTPLALNLACACLAQTIFGLTDVQRVSVSAQTISLLGSQAVVVDRNDLILTDNPQNQG